MSGIKAMLVIDDMTGDVDLDANDITITADDISIALPP